MTSTTSTTNHDRSGAFDELRRSIGNEQVRIDTVARALYSTDASNYQIIPLGVCFPRHSDDVIAVHEIANRYQIPILPRGAGTSLAGQTVGQALVMDFSRHMRRVRAINADTKSVTVEPGLILSHLNQQVKSLDLMFGPDPATADRCTFGGMIGNNSTGTHSILYGMTADHIRRLEVVLPSGECVWLDAAHPRLNAIRAQVADLVTVNRDEIAARYPNTWRTVAGYALNKIDPNNPNLNWLMAGSEGTLATVVQAELGLVPRPVERVLAMVHFDTLHESLVATPDLLRTSPAAVELIDRFMINLTRQHPEYQKYLSFVDGDPAAILIVEYFGDTMEECQSGIARLRAMLHQIGHTGAVTLALTTGQQDQVMTVRKAALGLVMSERGDTKSLNFVEDAAVPVEHLAAYIHDVDTLIREAGTTFAIYAHASAGCLHVQPLINLKSESGYRQYRQIADGVADLVVKYHGTITGEHGEGLARGEYSHKLFGAALTDAFRQVKRAFDPDNLMNPGKIVDPGRMDDPATLRYSPAYEVIPLQTRFDWHSDHGLNGAAEMCNGSGVCRKEGTGTMCPSYMATRDEQHSTRGRANALRLALSGQLNTQGIGSQALNDVFDLCLSCKACKAECPSSVDVARMKAEVKAHYHAEHGVPISTRIFASIHRLNQLGSLTPRMSNRIMNSAFGRFALGSVGVPTKRPLPRFARQRFSRMKPTRAVKQHHASPQATLIIDTFTEYNYPQAGLAVLKIAQALGLQVSVMRLPAECCGRPAISKGMLDQAKGMATRNVTRLHEQISDGSTTAPFLFLEPSCLSAFVDDYLTLVDPGVQSAARLVADRCLSVESWLLQHLDSGKIRWKETSRDVLLHGHCHQKALWSTKDTLALLNKIPGATVTEIDSGCCGVAGSFGYEHYELSMAIGNQRLLPTIAAHPESQVVAPGTSCRSQIEDAGYHALHPVEFVAAMLDSTD